MFKKSLVAVAVLGAAAFSAQAADVTLYGVVDTGLMYKYSDTTNMFGETIVDGESTFSMGTGLNAGSRFGLKGTEDLGNGLKVGFKLENGFESDTGKLKYDNRLFGREASVSLSGAFGTLSFGRMGGLTSGAGTYDLVFAMADAFDGGDNNVVTGFAQSSRYDNMITYATPEFGGVTGYVQYSFQQNGTENAQTSQNDRYAAIGAAYRGGALNLVGVVDAKFRKATEHAVGANGGRPTAWYYSDQIGEDQYTFNLGGSYDCGFAKTFVLAQYAKGADNFAGLDYADVMPLKSINPTYGVSYTTEGEGFDGYALHVGTIFDVAGGNMILGVYYADGDTESRVTVDGQGVEADAFKADVTYYGVSARYVYPLSKRTSLYAGAGYAEAKADYSVTTVGNGTKTGNALDQSKEKIGQAYVGLTHTF